MENIRLSRALCAAVGDMIAWQYSHTQGDALFKSSGAPGEPSTLSHKDKWKDWLFRAGEDESIDSLKVLGNVIEEFMDQRPLDEETQGYWRQTKEEIEHQLNILGLTYYGGGRVTPTGEHPYSTDYTADLPNKNQGQKNLLTPSSADEVITRVAKSLSRAMYPLTHRRHGSTCLSFDSEYDIQDLFECLLRPWISDIRSEDYAPSVAGKNSRVDFNLPDHKTIVEIKFVRDKGHAKKIGEELTIDISHYRKHPDCNKLWCIVYDPQRLISNPSSIIEDLSGETAQGDYSVIVDVLVV